MQLGSNKILLVDDDYDLVTIYETALTKVGFDIEKAYDGEEGLIKAKEGGYKAILLDVMMPKLDGLALLGELKNDPPGVPNGRIILMTNLSDENVFNEAKSFGIRDFILKTDYTPSQFAEKVKKLVSEPIGKDEVTNGSD